jgi:hypothetical protein
MSTPDSPTLVSSSLTRTTMREASTESTVPPRFDTTVTPESTATARSMPVPTSGVSERSVGTAWRCMFEPISARLASSCSRNGISEAATETVCFGETSMKSMRSRGSSVNSFWCLTDTSSSTNSPLGVRSELACAITNWPSSIADKYSMSSVTLPFTILR